MKWKRLVQSYNKEKEITTETCKNMVESQKHFAQWEKPER